MSSIRERLRIAREKLKESPNGEDDTEETYKGLDSQTRNMVSTRTSDLESRLDSLTPAKPYLPPEYSNIPALTRAIASKTDFQDGALRSKIAIKLESMTDATTVAMGTELFGTLSHGVSQKHVGYIFLLAFQLKKPGHGTRSRIFPDTDEQAQLADVSVEMMDSDLVTATGVITNPTVTGSTAEVACGFAYLASAFLKMFTRSPDNFVKSWNHILAGYNKFYIKQCPISGITPDPSVIKSIHDQFNITEIFKMTLYRYLYMANKDDTAISLRRHQYDLHLSHTGMHILPIFNRICQALNCTPQLLLGVLYSSRFHRQIDELIEALKLMCNTDQNHSRQMWKYGRIFDSEFLSALQTKACSKLVYTMACVLKSESSKTAENILNIKQLEEVSPEDRLRCQKAANLIIRAINIELAGSEMSAMGMAFGT